MMNNLASLIRKWMLPAAIVLGISLYLMYHFSPALHPYGKWLHLAASEGQRVVIAILLFFQFVKISPHDLKFRSWHFKALGIQVGSCWPWSFCCWSPVPSGCSWSAPCCV